MRRCIGIDEVVDKMVLDQLETWIGVNSVSSDDRSMTVAGEGNSACANVDVSTKGTRLSPKRLATIRWLARPSPYGLTACAICSYSAGSFQSCAISLIMVCRWVPTTFAAPASTASGR